MKVDHVINEYARQKQVFADLINVSLYRGKPVILPCDLQEADPVYADKRRDVLKEAVIKEDSQNRYVIFGIENQSEMDPTMPVRIMGYDVREYERQLRKNRDPRGLQGGEFLSGMTKELKLKPVVTIVVYAGNQKWDGAKSLKEMMGKMGKEVEEVFNDYRITVLEPCQIREEECRMCRSGVGKVLEVLKYSGKKEKMIEYLRREENREIDEETAKVIEVITKIPMNATQEGGKVDMCKATEEYAKECKELGRAEGIAEGIESGKKEAKIKTTERMIEDGFSDEMISKYVDLSVQMIQSIRKQTLIKA